jgi:hypothetical protein
MRRLLLVTLTLFALVGCGGVTATPYNDVPPRPTPDGTPTATIAPTSAPTATATVPPKTVFDAPTPAATPTATAIDASPSPTVPTATPLAPTATVPPPTVTATAFPPAMPPTVTPLPPTATARPALPTALPTRGANCSPAYPTVCIAPPPPDLDCKDIPYRRFVVLPPDPHRFDSDHNGLGCEQG